jgi:hypothetical protein
MTSLPRTLVAPEDAGDARRSTEIKVHPYFFEGREGELQWEELKKFQQFTFGYALTVSRRARSGITSCCSMRAPSSAKEATLQVEASAYAFYGEHHPQARVVNGATLHKYGLLSIRNENALWRAGKRRSTKGRRR